MTDDFSDPANWHPIEEHPYLNDPPKVTPIPGMTDTLHTRIAAAIRAVDDMRVCKLSNADIKFIVEAVIKNLNEYRREELLQFAIWLLKDENSEGREDQIVGKYLEKWRGSANCCEGGPQWGHAWTCPMAD